MCPCGWQLPGPPSPPASSTPRSQEGDAETGASSSQSGMVIRVAPVLGQVRAASPFPAPQPRGASGAPLFPGASTHWPHGHGQPRLQQRDHTQAPGQGPGCSPSWAPSSPQPWASSFPLRGVKPTEVRAPRLRVGRVKGGGRACHIRAPVSAEGATLGHTVKRGRARGACSSDPRESGRPEGQSPGRRGT